MSALIGVTMSWVPGDAARGREPRSQINDAYLLAVERAGAIPVPIAAGSARLEALFERLDGVVLTGGADIDPSRYGQPAHPETTGMTPLRDETEAAAIALAQDRAMPLLAICRGMQILNVVLGGTLHQHVPDAFGERVAHRQVEDGHGRDEATHAVRIAEGSLLSQLSGGERLMVNSMHHQAVDRLGASLVATAWAEDGVIEGCEIPGRPVLAVQWHPEELAAGDHAAAALFGWLVAGATERRAQMAR